MTEELNEHARAEVLASQIRLVFQFVWNIREYKDILEKVIKESRAAASFAMSAAPLFMATGVDYEEKVSEANIYAARAGAVLNMIEVLEQTDSDMQEGIKNKESKTAAQETLRNVMGF